MVTNLMRPSIGLFAEGADSKMPSLWDGLEYCSDPYLGVTGLQLRDVAYRSLHGDFPSSKTVDDWIIGGNPRYPGYAISYSGGDTADTIDIGSSLNSLNKITVCVWAKQDNTLATNSGLIGNTNNTTDGWAIITKPSANNNNITFQVRTDLGKTEITATSTGVNDEEWHLIVVRYDGVTMKIYIDGIEKASTAKTGTLDAASQNLYIGGWNLADVGIAYTGVIGGISIHNRGLTALEIVDSYIYPGAKFEYRDTRISNVPAAPVGRIMGALAGHGGLAGMGGIAGQRGGLAA